MQGESNIPFISAQAINQFSACTFLNFWFPPY